MPTDAEKLTGLKSLPGAKRCALALFVSFQLFYLLTTSGRLHTIDEYEAFYMTESLAERGELSLPPAKGFFGRQADDGRFYAPYGPLTPVVALPGYLLGKWAASGVNDPRTDESLRWFFTQATNTTIAAGAIALFFLLAVRLGASLASGSIFAAILGLTTPHWHYATTFFSQPLTALLLAWAAYLLYGQLKRPAAYATWVLCGLPLGLLALTRMTAALFFPILVLTVLFASRGDLRRRFTSAVSYCVVPASAVVAYLTWNYLRFGNALEPGYPATVEGGRPPSSFDGDVLRGLYGLTLSPGKGVLLFAPAAALGLAASGRFVRSTGAIGIVLLLLPLIPLTFYAGYSYWEGGYSWGPRYLIPCVGFWLLPLAFVEQPARPLRWVFGTVAVASFLFQAGGVAVSFLECQVGKGYYTADFRYDLSYSAPKATGEVVLHYSREALEGRFLTEKEGLGFDRWFLFLRRSGVSGTTLWASASILCAALGASIYHLSRTFRSLCPKKETPIEEPQRTPSESVEVS